MIKTIKKTIIIMISACLFSGFLLFIQPNVAEAAEETVLLGGMPIGIQAQSDSYTITDFIDVITKNGSFSPAQKSGLMKGDLLLSVNGIKPHNTGDLTQIIDKYDELNITVNRKGEILKFVVYPEIDLRENKKRVGLMIKNDLSGIGTVTYIRKNGNFGALGHPIADGYGKSSIYQSGTVYDCTVFGYNRAKKDTPGELIGQMDTKKPIGTFYSNTISGILGTFYALPQSTQEIPIGTQEDITPGKAYIYTTIDGTKPSSYEIEIIKKNEQRTEDEKSMVIRVTDNNLLKTTGGILQGMSGSPIIQNGKLIGAVTHVLTADSTMGYGIYIEWMLN